MNRFRTDRIPPTTHKFVVCIYPNPSGSFEDEKSHMVEYNVEMKPHLERLKKPTSKTYSWPVDKEDFAVGFEIGAQGPGIYSVWIHYSIETPLLECLSVSTDVEKWGKWVPTCKKMTNMTESLADNEWHQVGQIQIQLPLLFIPKKYKTRELTLSGQYFTDPSDPEALFMTFQTYKDSDKVPMPKGIPAECRMDMPRGMSRIVPLRGDKHGRTQITVYCDLDPKLPFEGPLWKKFINWLFATTVPFGMKAFRKQAKKTRQWETPALAALICKTLEKAYPPEMLYRGVGSSTATPYESDEERVAEGVDQLRIEE